MSTGADRRSDGDTTAVVIPFFQREPGILARAVASIDAQRLDPAQSVEVIVVDDSSPCSASDELRGFGPRGGVTVRVIRRPNGGAAAARNVGLDAVAPGTRWVAFLDSDDIWAPDHLARAHRALAGGAAMYFADNWVEPGRAWFAEFPAFEAALDADLPSVDAGGDRLHVLTGSQGAEAFINACLAHFSTIVLDARLVGTRRMDESLKIGEDHLFLVDVARDADRIAVSRCRDVSRGHGLDLFRSTLDWDHPGSADRAFYAMAKYRKMKAMVREPHLRRLLDAKIASTRRELLFLVVRNVRRFPAEVGRVLLKAIALDPAILASAWPTLAGLVLARRRGALDFRA